LRYTNTQDDEDAPDLVTAGASGSALAMSYSTPGDLLTSTK